MIKIEDLTERQKETISEFGVNSWFVLDLLESYMNNPESVGKDWQKLFSSLNVSGNGKKKQVPAPVSEQMPAKPEDTEEIIPVRGVGTKIIENMTASLSIPTASSLRTIPVKVLEENRRVINQYLARHKFRTSDRGKTKISYTHIIGWAIVKAIQDLPVMNNSYAEIKGEPHIVRKKNVNLGLAVDIEKKDGSRSLIVPNIKEANTLNFKKFFQLYDDVIRRSRSGKIEITDFQGTTITLTNPGTVGTVASSPRLMTGQGAIIASGSIDYPAEFQAVSDELRTKLGISKTLTLTSTYDHRIIQGAESGLFLKKIHELLLGEENFYETIFEDLEIPVKPVRWRRDYEPEETLQEMALPNIEEIEKQAKAIQLINMYRVRGHLLANLDPLRPEAKYHPELDPSSYGFTVWDYDRVFITDGLANLRTATLREILDILNQTYCDSIGVEYRHIQDQEEKLWLQEKMEPVRNTPQLTGERKKHILLKLIEAEHFEKFIHTRYMGHKRFSLEGSETIIPVLDLLLNEAAADNAEELVLGMAHRGRLNILANIVGKPLNSIFSEFEDITDTESIQGSGDVKYHLGALGEHKSPDGRKIKVSIASNPSHLEFVNPVVEGIVRAKQTRMKDSGRNKVIPVLLHGDAAIAGEGIVAETINLSQLQGYSTGGTIHIIINNQIGFTTSPVDARSTVYPSDVAKMVQAPIFHVNGDDPEAALWVTKLAFEYRQKFNKDVVLDIYSYRRLGHNEGDEPAFTQPVLYKKISGHPSVTEIYRNKLIQENTITEEEVKNAESRFIQKMNEGYDKAHKGGVQSGKPDLPLAVSKEEVRAVTSHDTKITEEILNRIVAATTNLPPGFNIHPKLKKSLEGRREFLKKDIPVDWSLAETLAFGTLLLEGISVRLSGQDSARGTFSQRHAVLTDVATGEEIIPLNSVAAPGASFEPLDSLLSEAAVLGFEFGYSTADPITLVLWEAQFGDFANAAQPIIDNFIVCSEYKWKVPNNLVMLLPHGQEGQGPEHSSARIERFLELCGNGNMTVCCPTTAAQYYHLLRTQGKYKRRRPLIVMTPKSLLRHPGAMSAKTELLNEQYKLVIDDTTAEKESARRLILTSGKVYYDLVKFRKENKITGYAIVRVERYYPFPADEIRDIINSYPDVSEVIWVQEEPENMGARNFMLNNLPHTLNGQKLTHVSRQPSPSPGPGSYSNYTETQKSLCIRTFS